jgi:hypothetical protein
LIFIDELASRFRGLNCNGAINCGAIQLPTIRAIGQLAIQPNSIPPIQAQITSCTFFMDDFQTLLNFPPEAGSGFVDRIEVTTSAAVPGPRRRKF